MKEGLRNSGKEREGEQNEKDRERYK
jgi:hypothetical protein